MPTFQCPNPTCRTQSDVPDKFVGLKVCCKKCRTEFMAGTRPAPPPVAVPPLPRTVITTAPPPPAPSTLAKKAPTTASTKVPAVVAVWRGPAGGGVGWLIAAFAAFLLPVAASAVFLALREPGEPPPPPGELYAGIEVASTAVSYTVFEVTTLPGDRYDYEVLITESRTTNINDGMAKTGVFHGPGMEASKKALRECFTKLTKTDKIPAANIFVVTSSGLLATLDDLPQDRRDEAVELNKAQLEAAVTTAIDKKIEFIDAEEEAGHQLDTVIESGKVGDSVYVDIGSGGTRAAYLDGAGRVKKLKLHGIKELMKEAKAATPPVAFANGEGEGWVKALIGGAYRKQAKRDEGFDTRKNVYLGGGIVWVSSLATHPKEQVPSNRKLHILLSARDLTGFVADVRKGNDFREGFVPPVGLEEDDKKRLVAEVERSNQPFPADKLAAGAEILSALAGEMKFSTRTVKFPRYANVSWVMGYIAKRKGWTNSNSPATPTPPG